MKVSLTRTKYIRKQVRDQIIAMIQADLDGESVFMKVVNAQLASPEEDAIAESEMKLIIRVLREMIL